MEQNLYWLSFVDPHAPVGQRFLGVCLVRAGSFKGALIRSHWLGCNPGGAVKGYEVPPEMQPELANVPRDQLLSAEQLKATGVAIIRDNGKDA